MFVAFVPTLKMMICIAVGFIITKRGFFPAVSAKGVSMISLVRAFLSRMKMD